MEARGLKLLGYG